MVSCRCVAYTDDGVEVTFYGDGNGDSTGLYIAEDGVEGWYGTPDLKTSFTERETGDGAHDVLESNILYASRTVTLHFIVNGSDRWDLVNLVKKVGLLNHHMVKFRFVDDDSDTYVTGMTNVSIPGDYGRDGWLDDCSLTITCPRPERLSWDVQRIQLIPTISTTHLGLVYNTKGLEYPLSYGANVGTLQNVGTLTNNGSSKAYPVLTVYGGFPNGFRIDTNNGSLEYNQPVGNVPLIIDSRSRTVTLGGVDVTRNLKSRGFPTVSAKGSSTLSLQSVGTGYITVEMSETYI